MRFEAIILASSFRLTIRLLGFRPVYMLFGLISKMNRKKLQNQHDIDMQKVRMVFSVVDWALQTHVIPSQCLHRSCVAHVMLFFRGIATRFRIGVTPHPFSAHAWLDWNGKPLMEVETKEDLRVIL